MNLRMRATAVLSLAPIAVPASIGLGGAPVGGGDGPRALAARVSSSTIDFGSGTTVSGGGAGLRAGAAVKVVLFPDVGRPATLARVRVNSRRTWTATVRPQAEGWIGAFDDRATVGHPRPAGASLRIELRTVLKLDSRPLVIGSARVVASGTIRPAGSSIVRIEALRNGRWMPYRSVRTDSNGRFRTPFGVTRSPIARLSAVADSSLGPSLPQVVSGLRLRRSTASWYGLYGGPLACGGRLGRNQLGVAHKTLPCGRMVTIHYRGRTATVPVIDRGPFIPGREWDLSGALAKRLGFDGVDTVWVSP